MPVTYCSFECSFISVSPALFFFFLLSLSFGVLSCVCGFVIGLCPIISENEDNFCVFDWTVTERESCQFSCNIYREPASSPPRASIQPWPCVFSAVLLLCIRPALVFMPIKSFLLPAFLLRFAPTSGFTIGLCPINSDNNDSLCFFDWIVPECGSSEFIWAASAILAVLSCSQDLAVCFPSGPTSRVRREWIPAQSALAKHHYLIEGGKAVKDTLQRARDQASSLDFCNAQNLIIPVFAILLCVCHFSKCKRSWNRSYIVFGMQCLQHMKKKSIPLLTPNECHPVVMSYERHHNFLQ